MVGATIVGLERIHRETVAGRVYRDLRNLIMAGQVSPGEGLTIRALATTLGTSMMPVRDAIARLAAERALEVLPNRTVRVPLMSRSRFEELRTIRLMVEGHAVEAGVQRMTAEGLDRLREIHDAFRAEHDLPEPDAGALIRLNKDFHFHVYAAAGMPSLLQIIEGLWLQIGPVLNFDLRSKSRRMTERAALGYHEELVQAALRGDAAAARAALVGDITSAGDFILECGALLTEPFPESGG
ncbi:GntR family transcriptional regulator (plasmid) [Skermanella rosea]|uniref:GntR family transcriptional regulator n=1 Tax=Skermanella rosea TaxID=1817965 RepID=UPI0019329BE2|nr:GntR family transcriptional regulator [Skermanella rosea]UEM07843.1 GntR family transcriptional regulator [Skermanella rosea]